VDSACGVLKQPGERSLNQPTRATATVRAELCSDMGKAQVVRFDMHEPIDDIKHDQESFWVDLCLTPRPQDARACYPDRWARDRFERIGEVFFVPPKEVLHARSAGGTQTSMVCQIHPDIITKWFDGDLHWTECRLEAGLHISDLSIRGLLLRLTREVCHPGFASDMLLDLIVPQLAIELGRYCASIPDDRSRSGLAAWRMRLIEERVRESGKAPSLAELAGLCNLSVRQLSRAFRISRGCSIGHYVEEVRIENAKRLLIGGQSIKSVAYSMGFSSPSSFSYAFRRATGVSPAEYRDRV
jgi:AraC family transcriptional regulator